MLFRVELHKSLDAALLAGSQELPNRTLATAAVNQYLALNLPERDGVSSPQLTITFTGIPTNRITARVDQQVTLWFMQVFGIQSTSISAEASSQQMSTDIMLALDRSGSMCGDYPGDPGNCPEVGPWQPMDDVKNAAVYFVTELGEEIMLGIVSYGTYPSTDVPLKFLEDELYEVVAGIQSIAPSSGADKYTDVGSSIHEAVDSLLTGGRPNPKVIVLLSDGRPNVIRGVYYGYSEPPRTYARQAASRADNEGIVIFSIAFGDQADHALMRDIAQIAHGLYYYAPDTDDLYAIFHDIASKDYVRLTKIPTS